MATQVNDPERVQPQEFTRMREQIQAAVATRNASQIDARRNTFS